MSDDDVGLEMFGVLVRKLVRDYGRQFEQSDQDWSPALILLGDKGLELIEIPGEMVNTPAAKDLLARALTPILAERQAVAAAFVFTAWQLKGPQHLAYAQSGKSFADHPDREEIVNVLAMDGMSARGWIAPIRRSPDRPPRLGAWEEYGSGESALIEGRFAQALARGLRPQG